MKVLILTQYFPPEVGAPQNRLYELAVRLQKKGAEVTILTAMPNYPQMQIHKEYKGKFRSKEEMDGLKIYRSWIFVSRSKSIFPRLMNYFSFVFSSFFSGWFRLGRFDYLICESPPLFLGISAFFLKKLKRAKMVFNVSDLWPESAEKLGLVTNRLLLNSASRLERFLYSHSELISGQTQGIVKSIQSRFPDKKVFWLPNGVDLEFYKVGAITSDWRKQNGLEEKDFVFLYAGIIGHAQGLEVILKAAQRLSSFPDIKFVLVGSGPEKEKLLEMKRSLQLSNVLFFDAVGKEAMPFIVSASDVSVVPLKKLDLFKGAIPSKIFENLAMKKPILLGVEGEAKELFIEEGKCGLAFLPEDDEDLAKQALVFYHNRTLVSSMGEMGLDYVRNKFTRDIIADKFWNFLKENHSSI